MTIQRLFRLETRLPIAFTAGAAAIATAAVLATTGAAQAPLTSLHFAGKSEKGVGFTPKSKPRQGDRMGFGDTLTGDDTGYSRGSCTLIGRGAALCSIQIQLTKGSLSAQGLVSLQQRSKNAPIAITGGTGGYDGARGTALVTDVTPNQTDITITLRP